MLSFNHIPISFHFISFHFISFHVVSFHFISFHFISFHSLKSIIIEANVKCIMHVYSIRLILLNPESLFHDL